MNLAAELAPLRQRIVDRLEKVLPKSEAPPENLHAAMRHGALVPGKCVRGCLVYASGQALGIDLERLDRLACALELVHAYSLVHDDLPCMDDDDIRRGRPSCHAAYGEATALLAGNALLLCAIIEVAGDEKSSENQRSAGVERLCEAAGSFGMVGGQQMDMELENMTECQIDLLNEVYRLKTGCLFHVAVMLPTELVQVRQEQRNALDAYGRKIGLAFQIRDDLEDMEQDALLPSNGTRPTYPVLLGVEESRKRLSDLGAGALEALDVFGDQADLLRSLGQWLTAGSGNGSGARDTNSELRAT